ncbi:MAG: helix-turn-helix domain-containing protein [Thermoleophilia bacterium]
MSLKEIIGRRFKEIRLQKELTQMQISKAIGYSNAAYVSDVERGKFIPQPDKLSKYANALGLTQMELDELVVEAKLEDIGLSDPNFTLMFKEVPNMTVEEKESVINAYEAVIKARSAKGKKKS